MSLIGGLLAGAAQGVSDSWTNRRLELKEEAANAFKQATIDQQQAQFDIEMKSKISENALNREATTNKNQAAVNSKALATYYKQIDGIDKLFAQNKLPQVEYDKLERKYEQQLSAVGIPIPQAAGRTPIELDGNANPILTKEQTKAAAALAATKGSIGEKIKLANNTKSPEVEAARNLVDARVDKSIPPMLSDAADYVGDRVTGLLNTLGNNNLLNSSKRALEVMNRNGRLTEREYKLIMEYMEKDGGMSKPENVAMYKKAMENLERLRQAK